MSDSPHYYLRVLSFADRPLDAEDEGDLVVDLQADIIATYDLDASRDEIVGRVSGWRMRLSKALNEGWDIVDAADAHSQAALEYIRVLYDGVTEELREDQIGMEMMYDDILVLNHVSLLPAHRGHKVGLLAAWRFLYIFSDGCAAAICKPYPLQFSRPVDSTATLELNNLSKNKIQSFAKLRRYWGRLGFRVAKSDPEYMVIFFSYQPGFGGLVRLDDLMIDAKPKTESETVN